MKEKGTLAKLAEEQAKVKELEGKLSTIKSTELKRLEELNSQAVALEQEREKQRLFRDEQGLKAQGELKKAEIDRLQKERELQARTAALITEQEKQRKLEAEALVNEQDRIRRAQLENEQHWSDLSRKSKLAQQNWIVIDDSLSLKQALEEVKLIKQELASLKKRMEYQYEDNVKTLKKAYALQIDLTKPKLPPPLTEKDAFESTEEYTTRRTVYESAVKTAESGNAAAIEKLRNEENLKKVQAKVEYIEQGIKVSAPFIERLKTLQARQFILPGEPVSIELGAPDADRSCFPSTIKCREKTWSVDWRYTDRNKARDFYSTRTFLKADALVQLDDTKKEGYLMTAARITHPGTGEQTELHVAEVQTFAELKEFKENNGNGLAEVKKKLKTAKTLAEEGREYVDPTSGITFIFVEGRCYQMGDTFGDGERDEKPAHEVCVDDYYIGKYEVTQEQWQKVMRKNPSNFKNCGGNCPVENVSWNDTQVFNERLNSQTDKIYRLPTEAEWEYAARSGGWKGAQYSGGNDIGNVAWYEKNSGRQTHPVGQKRPNGLGIYDMSGNVWEWVADGYDENYYSNSPKNNPQSSGNGKNFVLRGGSWYSNAEYARSATRSRNPSGSRDYGYGFRLARTR